MPLFTLDGLYISTLSTIADASAQAGQYEKTDLMSISAKYVRTITWWLLKSSVVYPNRGQVSWRLVTLVSNEMVETCFEEIDWFFFSRVSVGPELMHRIMGYIWQWTISVCRLNKSARWRYHAYRACLDTLLSSNIAQAGCVVSISDVFKESAIKERCPFSMR